MTGKPVNKKTSAVPIQSNELFLACVVVLLGAAALAFVLQSLLSEQTLAAMLISSTAWESILQRLGAKPIPFDDQLVADIAFGNLFVVTAIFTIVSWLFGALLISWRFGMSWQSAVAQWGWCWLWWLLPLGWEIVRIIVILSGFRDVATFLMQVFSLWLSFSLAGWLASGAALLMSIENPSDEIQEPQQQRVSVWLWFSMAISVVVFTIMNWQLYWSLLLPHGDSAMYEEHLWNVLHGKGFRSYLDQGLFLGEHIQFIHLFLIPVYLLKPSHLTLELCEAIALASGALPVYWLTLRATNSRRQALALSVAYLLYPPLHFLDISIDGKTFRPIGFGIPLLLFALDQLERRRLWRAALLLLITLSAKEDYALVYIPLGIWLACCTADTHSRRFGMMLTIGSLLYLLLAVLVLIPYFRSGADVHYARYFGELGDSPADIVRSLFTQPLLVLQKFFSTRTLLYVLLLVVPLAGLPLRMPSRLCVAAPLFGILSLMELSQDGGQQFLIPHHHFHAPLIPILFWACASAIGQLSMQLAQSQASNSRINFLTQFSWTSSFAACLFLSYTPISLPFWDAGSPAYWRVRYVPGERVREFEKVISQIPETARIASTDFIHPRFTHHERSYDYSNYPRAVNDGKPGAPPDTDYIVIDTQHPYSDIKQPAQIREYREDPDQWELLPDKTSGYFIILKRKSGEHDKPYSG